MLPILAVKLIICMTCRSINSQCQDKDSRYAFYISESAICGVCQQKSEEPNVYYADLLSMGHLCLTSLWRYRILLASLEFVWKGLKEILCLCCCLSGMYIVPYDILFSILMLSLLWILFLCFYGFISRSLPWHFFHVANLQRFQQAMKNIPWIASYIQPTRYFIAQGQFCSWNDDNMWLLDWRRRFCVMRMLIYIMYSLLPLTWESMTILSVRRCHICHN